MLTAVVTYSLITATPYENRLSGEILLGIQFWISSMNVGTKASIYKKAGWPEAAHSSFHSGKAFGSIIRYQIKVHQEKVGGAHLAAVWFAQEERAVDALKFILKQRGKRFFINIEGAFDINGREWFYSGVCSKNNVIEAPYERVLSINYGREVTAVAYADKGELIHRKPWRIMAKLVD